MVSRVDVSLSASPESPRPPTRGAGTSQHHREPHKLSRSASLERIQDMSEDSILKLHQILDLPHGHLDEVDQSMRQKCN